MSGISSVGSSMTAASYSPLDTNHDGIVDAQELQEAYAPYIQLQVADSQDGWILMTAQKL